MASKVSPFFGSMMMDGECNGLAQGEQVMPAFGYQASSQVLTAC
jgi:hypothetical protein